MFSVTEGQSTENCVLKVDTQDGVRTAIKKDREKLSKRLAANLLVKAQLYRVAANGMCLLRCLSNDEVDKFKEHITPQTADEPVRDTFNERFKARASSPQVWFLMSEVEGLDDFGVEESTDRRRDRKDSEEDIAEWLKKWKAWAQKALKKQGVWENLGSICVVDFIIGNSDRFNPYFPVPTMKEPREKVLGMPGNVLIGNNGPVGLDFFDPSVTGQKYWDLYEVDGKDDDWYGYFLSSQDWKGKVDNRYNKVFDTPLEERTKQFSRRIVKELMRLCDLTDEELNVDKAVDNFVAGMGSAKQAIKYFATKTVKAFCKDKDIDVPKGLIERSKLILGK